MAWIESHQKLEKSGKLLLLAQKLGINRYQAIGHLHCLWWWALDNACDGDVTRYSYAIVTLTGLDEVQKDTYAGGQIVDWYDSKQVINAFIEAGFIDEKDGKLTIHGWEEYTHRYYESVSKSKRNRELSRERMKIFRERNADVTHDVTVMLRNVTPPTKPNLTKPNKDKETSLSRFEEVWKDYPNKDGRKAAERSFNASVKTEQDFQDIQTALKNYLVSERVSKGFIKNGATWFNNWRDWIVSPIQIKQEVPWDQVNLLTLKKN